MSILCSFRHLALSFGTKVLFNQAELVIEEGDRIGLLGLNGKGKSSLFKILEGSLSANKSTPDFVFDKKNNFTLFHVHQDLPSEVTEKETIISSLWSFYPEQKKRKDRLEQLNIQLESDTSQRLLAEQQRLLEMLDHDQIWEVENSFFSYCKAFGLEDLNAPLAKLSGGQRKKVLLSLGLSSPASLILWDEPTNHLDIDTIKKFEDEIESRNQTFVMVSHDRYLLGKCTNKIFEINQGSIISYKGGFNNFLALQSEKENHRLKTLEKLQNSFRREDAWMKQGIKARGTRSKKRVENFGEIKNKIQTIKQQAYQKLELQVHSANKKTKQLIEASDLSFSYGNQAIFQNLNFTISRGDKIGLIGPNGAGKTTLLNVIEGTLAPSQGKLKRGPDLTFKHFSQNRNELPPESTPFELLGEGSDQIHLPGGQTQHVIGYFKKFLFSGDEIHRPLKTFSGGEKNRLQMAINLKQQADFYIFDEPTNDLDLETLAILEETLSNFQGSLIIISHDRSFLKNVTNRLFLLEHGKLEVFEGGYDQVEEYLELRSLEDQWQKAELSQKEVKEQEKPPESQTPQRSNLSSAQLMAEIEEIEKYIDKIDQLLTQMGLTTQGEETIQKMAQLTLKKEESEGKLLKLYEQIDLLDHQ